MEPCTILRVQTWDATQTMPPPVEHALGITWPRAAGTVACGRAQVLCVGPDDWLVISSEVDVPDQWRALDEALAASSYRMTDLSAAMCRVRLVGPQLRDLLAKGCSLDLDLRVFRPGTATRTRLAGIAVVLHCVEPATFECIVTASLLAYFTAWFADAALEFSTL